MRLCNFSLKGGVGRTTLALNLAGCYARDPSLRVLVNDRDPQGGACAFASLSDETPFSVGRSRSLASMWRSPTLHHACRTTK